MLTDTKLRALKPRPAVYRLADMGGLCIEVRPTGAKLWRYRYRVGGKPTMLGLGEYPSMSLQDARRERDRQRELLQAGTDPSQARRAARERSAEAQDDSFHALATEWLSKQGRWSNATREKAQQQLDTWVLPWIGQRPVREILPAEMLAVLRRPEAQGKIETAQRIKQRCGKVFRYGISVGRCDRDPTAELRGVLQTVKVKHHASLTDRGRVADMMRAIVTYHGTFIVTCALQLTALTFVRPGELRKWEWSEIVDDGETWRIPPEKMKMKVPHLVPLSRQARALLEELKPLTGSGRYVFRNARSKDRCMSENTVRQALRTLGFTNEDMTAHGFRSTASTLLNEAGWNGDWVERQLAHLEKNKVRGAYNYAQYLPDRRGMMQGWADLLDQLRTGGRVIRLHAAA